MSHPLLTPLRLADVTLRNRAVRTGANESMTSQGHVTDALIAHHATLARHQVALTTVAYGAVHTDGRTFEDQLLVNDAAIPGLRRLADAVHRHGGAVSLQLAHCGGFSKLPATNGRAPGGPSADFNPYGLMHGLPRIRALSTAEIEAIVDQFVQAARRTIEAGFDAVEVHCGHGYLLSQFLSPLINRRRDAWGGDLQGRARFAVQTVGAIREALGPGVPILVKLNTSDGLRGGLTVEESAMVAQWLADAGASALVPSGGLVQRTAFFLLRGRLPLREMVKSESHLLQKWALRLFAPFYVRPYRYSPMFFAEAARVLRDAVDIPVGLLGGIEGDRTIQAALNEGFAFVVMGRALIADPDLVARIAAGESAETRCTHCNACVGEVDARALRCVLPDRRGTQVVENEP